MTNIRQPVVAGQFYPDDPAELRSAIRTYLGEAETESSPLKAIIVPHAGYVYSGPVAGSGYRLLKELQGTVSRVVLLGPAHFVAFQGLAASSADVFETPLGPVPVDTDAVSQLLELPHVQIMDEAHAREHSLEVHLPFLQETLGEFQVVPLVVGQATPEQVADVIELLWGGPETVIVVSSDLSHHHAYETACRLDQETSQTIEQGCVTDLRGDRACGFLAIGGLLRAATKRGLRARTIDLRNSGDTCGSRDRVVGYGAYVILAAADGGDSAPAVSLNVAADESKTDPQPLSPIHEQMLLDVTHEAIQQGLEYGRKPETDASRFPPPLRVSQATFVTLTCRGKLRGCMGSLRATRPLVCDVASNAYSAAFLDPRFSPLTLLEADDLDTHISILSPPEAMQFESEADLLAQLRAGIDGLTIYENGRRGTLLPSVWEKIADSRKFLQTVKQKAGLPPDYWSSTICVERYTTTSIGHVS
jgi:hypothetical protein